jgi:DNA-directed RNA polymerase specialized sigma24 family protein
VHDDLGELHDSDVTELFKEAYVPIVKRLRRRYGRRGAEDAAQQAFTDLLLKPHLVAEHPNLAAWLHTAAKYNYISKMREWDLRVDLKPDAAAVKALVDASQDTVKPISTEEFFRILEALPSHYREILEVYIEGGTRRQMAKKMGLKPDAFKGRLQRAKVAARKARKRIFRPTW